MESSNRIPRPASARIPALFSFALTSAALACACAATPHASAPPATGAPLATTSQNVDKLTHTHPKLDFTVVQRWHLCDIDDLSDCTEQCATGPPAELRPAREHLHGREGDLARAAQILALPFDLGIGVARVRCGQLTIAGLAILASWSVPRSARSGTSIGPPRVAQSRATYPRHRGRRPPPDDFGTRVPIAITSSAPKANAPLVTLA
jgi:hypothetical protein